MMSKVEILHTSPNADAAAQSSSLAHGDVKEAVRSASSAADPFAATSAHERAALLRAFADALESDRSQLVSVADLETGLGPQRLNGELDRTCFQLRGFADAIDHGAAHVLIDDPAVPGAPPVGRPHLRRVRIPIGPVAVFSASNFPFAFSVLGGDTASAIAAGNPVVVKGHPAHPVLSLRVAKLASQVVEGCGLPDGVFQYVHGDGVEVGAQLVNAPEISAVAFTGSFQGGTALARLAAERPRPIPFYGELGSVNPLILLPSVPDHELAERAIMLAASICQGAGQFCTSPGIVLVEKGAKGDEFVRLLAEQLRTSHLHRMLSPRVRHGFDAGVAAWRAHEALRVLVDGAQASEESEPTPFLAEIDAFAFVGDPALQEEVFGAAALVIRTSEVSDAIRVLRAVGGALTVTLWGVPAGSMEPDPQTKELVRVAVQVAGRVLFSGVPTGVAVTAAQHHGGPFPASTAPFTTSVGYAALDRFLRPVALQDAPEWLNNRNGRPC